MPTIVRYSDELYHYGIKDQKWYVRRYQNEDGSLTPAGRERYRRMYGVSSREEVDSLKARQAQFHSDYKTAGSNRERRALHRSYMKDTNYKSRAKTRLAANGKRLAKGVAKTAAVGAGLAAVGLAARGMYNRRLNKAMNAHTSETGSRSRSSNKYYSRKTSRKVSNG